MHDHAHSRGRHAPASEHSGSRKIHRRGPAQTGLLLLSAGARLGLAGSAVAGLWLAVLWAL
ncbi:MAG: hypothetical protein FJX60_17800 [Alphaproteobacteria bacterium]|nr:hypothetical protein [Alphaproteobacteria bacterium]